MRIIRYLNIPLVVLAATLAALSVACASTDGQTKTTGPDHRETVVLLHGLGRSNNSMWRLARRLEDAGFAVARVEYSSLDQSPEEILEEVSAQIGLCCAGSNVPLHFVGHSLGGLVIRAYLQHNRVENLGRVVLVGTPNQGTELVDNLRHNWFFKHLGPTTAALGTDEDSLPRQLAPPYYPVGIIAGVRNTGWNDRLLPGRDDGLVPVESTKLAGMSDFVEIKTGHGMMRYSGEVARQVINFLRHERFARTGTDEPNTTGNTVQRH